MPGIFICATFFCSAPTHHKYKQSIFRIQSGVCQFFREFLTARDFIEIHSPKLLGGASEGGANVFTLDYFGTPACLAQVGSSDCILMLRAA
jgi:aspartyl/asparaginyl-tRNA synthetase